MRILYLIRPSNSSIRPFSEFIVQPAQAVHATGRVVITLGLLRPVVPALLRRYRQRQGRPFVTVDRMRAALPTDLPVEEIPFVPLPRMTLEGQAAAVVSYLRTTGRSYEAIQGCFLDEGGYLAAYAGHRLGIPSLAQACGSDVDQFFRSGPADPGRRRRALTTLRDATLLTAASSHLAGRISHLAPQRSATVLHGAIADYFQPEDSTGLARRYPQTRGRQRILFVGRVESLKGVPELLEAVGRLVAARRDIHLFLVGDPHRDVNVAATADRLGITDRVTVVGEVDQQDLPAWYSFADLFCLPSRSEGLGYVVAEALACGTPVVATRVGGIPEILPDTTGGVLVPPGDPDALAAGLTRALDHHWDGTRLPSLVAGLRWEQVTSQYLALYDRLGRTPAPAPASR